MNTDKEHRCLRCAVVSRSNYASVVKIFLLLFQINCVSLQDKVNEGFTANSQEIQDDSAKVKILFGLSSAEGLASEMKDGESAEPYRILAVEDEFKALHFWNKIMSFAVTIRADFGADFLGV